MSDPILDYSELVRRYEAGLIETLRGFGFHTDYLDLWVPDPDIARSILNLMDAAATIGHTTLAIRLTSAQLLDLNRTDFSKLAQQRGSFKISDAGDGGILRLYDLHLPSSDLHSAATAPTEGGPSRPSTTPVAEAAATAPLAKQIRQPEAIGPLYVKALEGLSETLALPSQLATSPGLMPLSATCDGLVLEAQIDTSNHHLQAFACRGARSETMRRLVCALSEVLKGLPILEAADHGAIRLEYWLRSLSGGRPHRPGILLPVAMDAAFAFVNCLTRGLLADYREKSGYFERFNDFDPGPGAVWLAADDTQRRDLLTAAFAKAGFDPASIDIVAIEFNVRIVVALKSDLATKAASTMLRLERSVKAHVDGRLELFLSELKDSNKIRRLSKSPA